MIKFKTPGWQRVMQPKFTKSYCRPFKTNHIFLDDDLYTRQMFQGAHESLLKICYRGKNVIDCMPEEFLYEQEIIDYEDLIIDKRIEKREKAEKAGPIISTKRKSTKKTSSEEIKDIVLGRRKRKKTSDVLAT